MKKFFKQIIAGILAGILVTVSAGALAYEYDDSSANVIEPYYVGATSAAASLSISSRTATCKGTLALKSKYTASCTMVLQRRRSGGSWSAIKTWTSLSGSTSKTCSISSGYDYRVRFYGNIYNSSGTKVDSFNKYSVIKSY